MHQRILLAFCSVFAGLSCKSTPVSAPQGESVPSAESSQSSYFSEQAEGLLWFRDVSIADAGLPLLVFQLLPAAFPEIWHGKWMEEIGLFAHPDPQHFLPYGFSWTQHPHKPEALSQEKGARLPLVNFTCASCHTGRVRLPSGEVRILVGAPSTQMDLSRWRSKLAQTVSDPRFNAQHMQSILDSKPIGSLYPDARFLEQEKSDRREFAWQAEPLLEQVKKNVLLTHNSIHEYLGVMGYEPTTLPFLDRGSLGQLEGAFGSAISKVLPREWAQLPVAERQQQLADYLPPKRTVVDIPSVWLQRDKRYGQWDGNIESKILRNLGAELGVVPDPSAVNYDNAVSTAKFIAQLPPPEWPFPIDAVKAEAGRPIFERICAGCHRPEAEPVSLSLIATDPARAYGLTPSGRLTLSRLIVEACRDTNEAECKIPADQVIADRSRRPGYVPPTLRGIWARAPYFHNGSVPTIAQVLQPRLRAASFYRGRLDYDTKEMGFAWREAAPRTQLYDTRLSGYSNAGHSLGEVFFGGIDFEKDEVSREALLEYLKTL